MRIIKFITINRDDGDKDVHINFSKYSVVLFLSPIGIYLLSWFLIHYLFVRYSNDREISFNIFNWSWKYKGA